MSTDSNKTSLSFGFLVNLSVSGFTVCLYINKQSVKEWNGTYPDPFFIGRRSPGLGRGGGVSSDH